MIIYDDICEMKIPSCLCKVHVCLNEVCVCQAIVPACLIVVYVCQAIVPACLAGVWLARTELVINRRQATSWCNILKFCGNNTPNNPYTALF